MKNKAYSVYRQSDVVDVEVQMLSKNCKAVTQYLRAIEKKREAKKIRLPDNTKEAPVVIMKSNIHHL